MNFVGKFDAQLPNNGSTAHSYVHVEHPTAHAPADAIIVPDAHLLFGADFKRSGVDLILSNADRELVVHDYFKGEHHRPLASPDGAHLTGDIVNALTGQVDYAQAADGSAAAAHVIGHVTKLAGSATAIRNGVSIILNQGDNVEKGDVVATGSDSTLGVTFIDGTVFGLSSNARMVLNEMVYDPNGSNNSSLISLVSGTISFVAGETAKHGDMKVDTPVATMGIRGTAVLVEIDFNVPGANGLPDAKFQVLVEPDGTTGSYILFDKTTLDPIATVNKAGQQVNINQNGISYTNSPLSPELQKLISDVFTQKFSNTDTNTKLVEHFTDSIVPPTFQSISGPTNVIIQTVFIPTNTLGNGPSQNQGPSISHPHIDVAPTVVASSGLSGELLDLTGSHTPDVASGFIRFADLNGGDQPTASTAFNSFVFQNAQKQDISHSLTPTELAAVQAVEVALNVAQDPSGINVGTATWTYSVPDGALDFLGAGETLTLTYLATVSNNFSQSVRTTTVPITVTITGTNDVPVITSVVPQTIAFNSGTSVAGGNLLAHVPTAGTIAFDDPDLTDTHTVSVSTPTSTMTDPTTGLTTAFVLPPTPAALFGSALTASIATDSTGTGLGTVNWSLADLPVWLGDYIPKGDTLTITYVVTVTDSHGATSFQDITVAITGTDTPAEVWVATTTGPSSGGLWSDGTNWETGYAPTASDDAIIITNQLEGLTPTYPVTITSAVGIDGAVANSLTMDNYGGAAPVLINQDKLAIGTTFDINDHSTGNPPGYTGPEFDNQGTATVGGAFNLNADAVVNNSGHLTVDGKMEVLDQSSLQNSGTITLAGGGDFSDQSTVSNTATGAMIDVSGGTLNVAVDISNLGTIEIDSPGALTLSAATIDGGTVTSNGTLTLNGAAVLKNGILGNSSQINVSGTGNALDNETVTNTGAIEVMALGALTLDLLTTVGDAGHTITVDGTGTLTLQGGSSITGGSLANSGTVGIEGTGATFDGVTVTGAGAVNVDAGVPETTTLVLKDVTSITKGTLTVGASGILSVAGSATLDHVGVTNQNSIEVTAGHALTLDDGASVDNTSGTVTVDGTGTLTLNDASINGGAINDSDAGGAGTIDVTGSSTISNAALNHGNVTIGDNSHLTLDGSTVTGTSFDDTADGAVIQVDGGAGDTVQLGDVGIEGGGLTVAANGLLQTSGNVTLTDTSVTNDGTIEVTSGKLTITGSGSVADSAANDGGKIQIDAGAVLDLNVSDTQNVSFDGAGAELQINTGSFGGTIVGLAATDQIDLSTIGYGLGTTATYVSNADHTGGILTVTDGSDSIALQLVGDYSNAHFAGSADKNGDLLITLHATDDLPAFASGETAQTASVAELANTTASPTADDSSPASGAIHFTDIDLTDRPTASVTQTVTWTGGTLSDLEASALKDAFSLTPVTNTNNGEIDWTYAITDSSLDFLAAGETATMTATITLDDHQGGQDAATVTVTIDGSNDAPVLAADTSGANGTGLHAIAERAGETGDTADTDSASGTLSFTDVDLNDTHTATEGSPTYVWSGGSLTTAQVDALTSAGTLALTEIDSTHTGAGAVDFTYSAADSTFDFLAAGETLTVTYEITVTDKSGVSSSEPVTFTVTGSNDAPVLAADTSGTNGTGLHAIAERAGETGDTHDIDSASGALSFTDVDLSDTHEVTEGGPTYVWSGGSLTAAQINALTSAGTLALTETDSTHTGTGSVGFTYSAADSTFDFLAAGQTLTVTYDITVTDKSGASSSEPVTFTVTGSNDAPTIVGETNPATQTIILAQSPFVLSAGTATNSLGLPTETFDEAGITAGSASNNGFGHGSFTSSALGAHFSASGNAGVVHGSSSATAAPFIGPLPGHADTTNYLSIGANGSETLTFATEQNEFGLYWGSADTFNTVSFYDGNQLVASYSGADVAPLLANGNQGSFSANGYVEFSDLAPFTKVVLASGSNAFEIDNISAGFVSDSHVHLAGPITGTLTVNDADIGDTLTASVTGNAVATYNGSTTLPSGLDISALIASGAITFDTVKTTGGQDVLDWTYNPANANLDFLEPGDKLTLTFNATVSDGHATTANQALTVTLVGNGSSVVNGTVQNDTFTDVGGGVTISGDGGHDTYNFNAHFDSATITDFDVSNDVIDISSTLFTSVTALLNSAVGSGANTIITDSAGDQITLDHVKVAQLKANPGDFQLTIANGGTFEVGVSTSENVVFEGSTGKLTIDTPSSFTGVISGFSGDGTLAGSDQIDLKGINYNSSHFTESFDAADDTLLVSDGTDSATLHFNGTYQAANFKFTTDNSGGTIVYDPPVAASAAANAGANTPPVSSNGDGFVFNFAGNGHGMPAGNHPAGDTHLFDGQAFVNAGIDLNKPHDDGHGQAAPVPESMDAATLATLKAQWHVHDFHFV